MFDDYEGVMNNTVAATLLHTMIEANQCEIALLGLLDPKVYTGTKYDRMRQSLIDKICLRRRAISKLEKKIKSYVDISLAKQ